MFLAFSILWLILGSSLSAAAPTTKRAPDDETPQMMIGYHGVTKGYAVTVNRKLRSHIFDEDHDNLLSSIYVFDHPSKKHQSSTLQNARTQLNLLVMPAFHGAEEVCEVFVDSDAFLAASKRWIPSTSAPQVFIRRYVQHVPTIRIARILALNAWPGILPEHDIHELGIPRALMGSLNLNLRNCLPIRDIPYPYPFFNYPSRIEPWNVFAIQDEMMQPAGLGPAPRYAVLAAPANPSPLHHALLLQLVGREGRRLTTQLCAELDRHGIQIPREGHSPPGPLPLPDSQTGHCPLRPILPITREPVQVAASILFGLLSSQERLSAINTEEASSQITIACDSASSTAQEARTSIDSGLSDVAELCPTIDTAGDINIDDYLGDAEFGSFSDSENSPEPVEQGCNVNDQEDGDDDDVFRTFDADFEGFEGFAVGAAGGADNNLQFDVSMYDWDHEECPASSFAEQTQSGKIHSAERESAETLPIEFSQSRWHPTLSEPYEPLPEPNFGEISPLPLPLPPTETPITPSHSRWFSTLSEPYEPLPEPDFGRISPFELPPKI